MTKVKLSVFGHPKAYVDAKPRIELFPMQLKRLMRKFFQPWEYVRFHLTCATPREICLIPPIQE